MARELGSYAEDNGFDSQEWKSNFFPFFISETFRGFVYYQLGSGLKTQNLNLIALRICLGYHTTGPKLIYYAFLK